MKQVSSIIRRDLSNGIIQGIDNALAPINCAKFAHNLFFDRKLGRAIIRGGTDLIGNQIASDKNILGLYQFNTSDDKHYLLSVVNVSDDSSATLYRLDSGTWTAKKTSLTANAKVRFLTYLDTVMAINGTDHISSTDGETWVDSGGNLDIGNCPAGKYAEKFLDRIYVAGVSSNPDRLYYSSIPTGGAISWTTDNGYIDIEPQEGEGAITGLCRVPGYLLIFKQRTLKRWNGSSTFPDDLCNLGSPSQESIVFGKNTAFFFSASYQKAIGFYETNGETTRKISRPIQDIVEAIDPANYTSIAGFSDGENVMWSVGDITYNGIAYSNVVVFYNISSQTWTTLGYPTRYTVFSPYISGTSLYTIAGNNNGEVIQLSTGTTDNTTNSSSIPIHYHLTYHPIEVKDRALISNINKIVLFTAGGQGALVSAKIDEKGETKPIATIDSDIYEKAVNLKGHAFEFSIDGRDKSGDLEIIGLELLTPFKTSNVTE